MRDIFVTLLIFGATLFAFTRPWFGLALYVFVSVGVPHKMTWGFASTLPFAQIIAIVTLLALMYSREPKSFPIKGLTIMMLAFSVWMTVSTFYALEPVLSWEKWQTVMKIMFMVFVALVIVRDKKHIEWLVGAITLTIAFYGVKGGFWTFASGGSTKIYGPPGGFIGENNSAALAIVMTIPLIYYFYLQVNERWIKRSLLLVIVLCSASVLGSYSRGALLALATMGAMLWWKSKKKFMLAAAILLLVPLLLSVMPEKWWDRMHTISTHEQDSSAMSRLDSWETMFNIAKDRPFTGGGYRVDTQWIYQIYAPHPESGVFVAHSIYFATMGEHGFLGLAIFLGIGLLGFRTVEKIIRLTKSAPELRWMNDLARMIKVSLIGFAVGGAFLSMTYFEMPYFLIVALIAMDSLAQKKLKTKPSADRQNLRAGTGKSAPTLQIR